METYNAQQLMAGFSAFTTAGEVAASPIEGEGISVTTTPITTLPPVSPGPIITTIVTLESGC
jgi:hypothetical protein